MGRVSFDQAASQDVKTSVETVGPKVYRKGQPWAREKLDLVRYYLGGDGHRGGGFMKATQKAGGSYYLDLFAGPGQCEMPDGEIIDGSPLIAAKARPAFTRQFWVDDRSANAQSLRAHREDYPDRAITILDGDANTAVEQILRELPRTYPTFAFLDPEGSELSWTTVARLASHKTNGRKVELFIHFATDTGILRFFPHDPSKAANDRLLDRMMPSPLRLRALYAQRATLSTADFRRALVHDYMRGLSELGYRHVLEPRLIRRPDRKPLYFLVFATDDDAGRTIMQDALDRVRAEVLQPSLLPYHQQY